MTAHELARHLLDGPNGEVGFISHDEWEGAVFTPVDNVSYGKSTAWLEPAGLKEISVVLEG